jgi:pimeloyl-ACP methyl ester carboxylesterase
MEKQLVTSTRYADLCCNIYGSGERSLLAFHGYGQDGSVYEKLPISLTNHTVYSFHLFYHGLSTWKEKDLSLDDDRWRALIEKFLIDNNIGQFDLMGFSIGCRLVFSILKSFHARIQRLWLVAPDGISDSFLYRLAVDSRLSRKVFFTLTNRNELLLRLLSNARSFGWLSAPLYAVARMNLLDHNRSMRLFDTWVLFRHMKINTLHLAEVLNEENIRSVFIVAGKDELVPWRRIKKLFEKLDDAEKIVLPCTHQGLIGQTIAWIGKKGSIDDSRLKINP